MRLCLSFSWRKETPAIAMASTATIVIPKIYRRFTSILEPHQGILNVTQSAAFLLATHSGKKYPGSSFAPGQAASERLFVFQGSRRIGIAHRSRQPFRDEEV